MLKQMKDLGEEQLTRLATRLLANETFVQAVQGLVSGSLRTREYIENSVRIVLCSLSIPTSEDLDGFSDRLADIEAQVEALSRKIEAVERSNGKASRNRPTRDTLKSTVKSAES